MTFEEETRSSEWRQDQQMPPPSLCQLVSIPPTRKHSKSEDRVTPKRSTMTRGGRPWGNPLFAQRMSSNSHSSDSDSPSFRRVTSAVSNPDDRSCAKYLVRTPRALDSDSDPEWLSREVIRELSKEANEENRAPSPRPSDAVQLCVEHNKQMQVWEDFVAMSHGLHETEETNTSFRRTHRLEAPEYMPKALEPQSAEELECDEELF